MTSQHHWICGGVRRDREDRLAAIDLPIVLSSTVDAHRQLRGPYTAAGTVLRAIVPTIHGLRPELLSRHEVEILATAPELRRYVPATRETLTSLAVPAERTRYYSKARTLRIAHGLTELFRDWATRIPGAALLVENAEHADPTDAELLAAMLRRIDPGTLTIVVCGGKTTAWTQPLASALSQHTTKHSLTMSSRPRPPGDRAKLAKAYVEGDCTSDDPWLRTAYDETHPADRAGLHDQRAADLDVADEMSLRLGAIPFHRERGTDPVGAGAAALEYALDYCSLMGYYHATIDLAVRARSVVNWDQPTRRATVNSRMAVALLTLDRVTEAEALYDETRRSCTVAYLHMKVAYMTAMLYTRFYPPQQRDEHRSRMWINQAIAIAQTITNPAERAFLTVFNQNGLALIEVQAGNLNKALQLVTAGLNRLDRELTPDDHMLHRSVLRYNRAQVCVGLGLLNEALADYDSVIDDDPNYAEYYFDRGNLLRRIGRYEEAITDYQTAMRLSPPFAEVYYNRGDLLANRGDLAAALTDFEYVLELDPDFLDARINRAALFDELGEYRAARREVELGLATNSRHARLLCLLGQIEAHDGDIVAAAAAFDAALAADPTLQAVWAARATLTFETGDYQQAISNLDQALKIGDDATLRFNRALALIAAGRWADALTDLDRASELDPDDPDVAAERERCRSHTPLD